MSSTVCLQATEFVNKPQGTKTFGYRIYDDCDQMYDNNLEIMIDDDLELLQYALTSDNSRILDMLSFLVEETQCGMEINGQWYEWDKIKQLFEE
jgi:hypothetical protein